MPGSGWVCGRILDSLMFVIHFGRLWLLCLCGRLCWSHCQRGDDRCLDVRDRKIYREREGLERCLKSWMLGNTEGDDQYFRGDLCPFIFVGFVSLSASEVHPRAANA